MSLTWRVKKLVDHVWGPTGSLIIHVILIVALLRFVTYTATEKAPEVEVVIMEPDATDLEEFQKELDKIEDMPEMVEAVTPPDVQVEVETPPDVEPSAFASAEPTVDFAALDVRNDIQSPLVMRGLFQGRSAAGRSSALKNYGGQWGQFTEAAVVKALEWLKRKQAPDGSWGPNKTAMTGLGLLTFLAHGETTSSEKYGQTVEKAIRFLISQQDAEGRFCKTDDQPGPYAHGIGTYAISEAYGLTRIPSLKPVMEKAIQVIVNGQQPKGGWNYNYSKGARRDTSVGGWQIQALKSAYIAGAENPGLKEAMERAVEDIKSVQELETGRFYYTDTSGHKTDSITGIAVLCLQLLGHSTDKETRNGLQALTGASCDWDKPEPWPMYAWYYITQAKFHQGGQTWSGWNSKFARLYVKNQNEDGSWTSAGANLQGDNGKEVNLGPVYSTTLAALTLQVYYRFLPTYKPIAVEPVTQTDTNDVQVQIL
ncbi:MAG: prenyltransferase/squalene oxidase repeat-containing protein [Verrucomicrobiota bacterium]